MTDRTNAEPGPREATGERQAATSSDFPVTTATPPAYLVESSEESTGQE